MTKIGIALLVLLVLSLATFVAASAVAKEVPIGGHSLGSVKKACNGVSWGGHAGEVTYGCMNKDGSGIVCGGVTAQQKKTCSTFRPAPKGSTYRRELRVAVARG